MIKRAKKGHKKERRQSYDGEIETMPLIYSSYAIITEMKDTKKIAEKLRLQYQEEYDKLHRMKNRKSDFQLKKSADGTVNL